MHKNIKTADVTNRYFFAIIHANNI